MTHHKGTMSACQYLVGPDARETTPASTASKAIDHRLVQRYGVALLGGGYTALPTYAYVYYARLGVTEAELVFIGQLCTYWWSTRDPYPGEGAIAARMGKTTRTIQGYIRSLGEKGLLHIHTRYSDHGRQHTNRYDVRPFFAAVEGLARLDGLLDDAYRSDDTDARACASAPRATPPIPPTPPAPPAPAPQPARAHTTGSGSAEQDPLCAVAARGGAGTTATDDPALTGAVAARGGAGTTATDDPALTGREGRKGRKGRKGEESCAGRVKNSSPQVNPLEIDRFDLDSMPPTPIDTSLNTTRHDAEPPSTNDADDQALTAEIIALSRELGDDAPRSSLGRARNLHHDAGVSLDRFLCLLDEAAARTRDRQASIVKRRRDGATPNGMPYLFAVLQDLVHPAPPRTRDGSPNADGRQSGPAGRRRRRRAGYGEASGSYAAWSDSPAPLPIVEEHPVWRAVLAELAQVMTSENFNAWLASTRALDQDGDVLRVAVFSEFNKVWLEQKLHGKVMGMLHKINYDALHAEPVGRVAYVVEATACIPTEATARAS